MANRFCGCFVWALAPFFVLVFCFAVCFAVSSGETQVWLGDLRVVVFGWPLFFVCVLFYSICRLIGLDMPLYKCLSCLCSCKNRGLARHRVKILMNPNSAQRVPNPFRAVNKQVTQGTKPSVLNSLVTRATPWLSNTKSHGLLKNKNCCTNCGFQIKSCFR